MRYPFYVGTFGRTGDECIHIGVFDDACGSVVHKATLPTGLNPSYVNFDMQKRFLFAVMQREAYQGFVRSYRVEPQGITAVCDVPTGGLGPCYVAVSFSNRYVAACNYRDGSFRVFALDASGRLTPVGRTHRHKGSGANPVRQAHPHCHSTVWSPWQQDVLYVCDLGTDTIARYQVSPQGVRKLGATQSPPGFGPRHLTFCTATRRAYLVGEISSELAVYAVGKNGALKLAQVVSMLPEGFLGENTAADVHLSHDGRFVYASNRGHDSIVCYPIDASGLVGSPAWTSCAGRTPRGFILSPDQRWLLCANQDSGEICVFARDSRDGSLALCTAAGQFGKPCNIRF